MQSLVDLANSLSLRFHLYVIRTQTWGDRMEVADESTELWQHLNTFTSLI